MKSSLLMVYVLLYLCLIALPNKKLDNDEAKRKDNDTYKKWLVTSLDLTNLEILGSIVIISLLLSLKILGVLAWW